jgi:dTDP-4-amino-4,6-dideoxygalactose transaminase
LPEIPSHCQHPYHLFYLLTPSPEDRDRLMEHLAAREIASAFHYQPLHLSPMGRRLGGREGDCPVAEDVSRRLLRLPFYADLNQQDQEEVISSVRRFDDWSSPVTGVRRSLSAGSSGRDANAKTTGF